MYYIGGENLALRGIIVDDDDLILDILETMVLDTGLLEIRGKFTNPLLALEQIQKEELEVIFLDIQMPDINGLELAEKILQLKHQVQIVFITAHSEYAVEAFEVNALDYLLKPVSKNRLLKTLSRLTGEDQPTTSSLSHSPLTINCFRTLEVSLSKPTKETIKWRTAKAKELFAYLWHHRGKYLDKYTIIDVLWPEMDLDKALTNLHTTIYYLRKTFSALGFVNLVEYNRGSYKLELSEVYCDVDHFDYVFKEKYDDPLSKSTNLLQLYQGDYLGNEAYNWAEAKRQQLRLKLVKELEAVSSYYQQQGDELKKLEYLSLIIQIDPYAEKSHREILQIYSTMGRKKELIAHYQSLQKKLLIELETTPEEETRLLYKRALE